MEPVPQEGKKSLDQLLGQALAERSREDDQVEVTYELGDNFSFEKQQRLRPNNTPSRTPSLKEDPEEDNTEPLGSVELDRKVMKNTITLSIAIILCCNGFTTLQSLQSSVFPQIGVEALCTIYSFATLSCICAPAVIYKIGLNWTCVTYAVMSVFYLSSFYFYNAYSFIISAVLLGISFGPIFCAFVTYMSLNVSRLPYVTQVMRDKTQQRFLKYFCVIAKSNFFWGNLITSLVMHFNVEKVDITTATDNSTSGETEISATTYDFCFQVSLKESEAFRDFSGNGITIQFNSLHQSSVRLLVLIFVSCIVIGVILIVVFLERIEFLMHQDPMERPLILQTLRQIRLVLMDKQIRLAIPLMVFIGIEQGFILADFTRSYVSCSLGLEAIVFTMMCLGGSNTLGSVAVHLFSEHIQRTIIMAAGLVCQSGLLMVLYLWTPVKDDAAVFYVITGGWGLCNAIWETLTITYIASTYVDDWQIPFTTYHLLQYLGMALSFSISNYLGSQVKVCILAATLMMSIVPYTILEFRIHHRNIVHNRTAVL